MAFLLLQEGDESSYGADDAGQLSIIPVAKNWKEMPQIKGQPRVSTTAVSRGGEYDLITPYFDSAHVSHYPLGIMRDISKLTLITSFRDESDPYGITIFLHSIVILYTDDCSLDRHIN